MKTSRVSNPQMESYHPTSGFIVKQPLIEGCMVLSQEALSLLSKFEKNERALWVIKEILPQFEQMCAREKEIASSLLDFVYNGGNRYSGTIIRVARIIKIALEQELNSTGSISTVPMLIIEHTKNIYNLEKFNSQLIRLETSLLGIDTDLANKARLALKTLFNIHSTEDGKNNMEGLDIVEFIPHDLNTDDFLSAISEIAWKWHDARRDGFSDKCFIETMRLLNGKFPDTEIDVFHDFDF